MQQTLLHGHFRDLVMEIVVSWVDATAEEPCVAFLMQLAWRAALVRRTAASVGAPAASVVHLGNAPLFLGSAGLGACPTEAVDNFTSSPLGCVPERVGVATSRAGSLRPSCATSRAPSRGTSSMQRLGAEARGSAEAEARSPSAEQWQRWKDEPDESMAGCDELPNSYAPRRAPRGRATSGAAKFVPFTTGPQAAAEAANAWRWRWSEAGGRHGGGGGAGTGGA